MVKKRSINEVLRNGRELQLAGKSQNIQYETGPLQKEQDIDAALVSVVIPCYNQAHFLGEATESILSQIFFCK